MNSDVVLISQRILIDAARMLGEADAERTKDALSVITWMSCHTRFMQAIDDMARIVGGMSPEFTTALKSAEGERCAERIRVNIRKAKVNHGHCDCAHEVSD